jgi:ribosomal protein S20
LASGSYEAYIPLLAAAPYLARTIDKVLEWYSKVLEIRKRRLELKELGAPTAETTAIKKYEKDLVDNGVKALAKEILKEANPKVDPARKNELEIHLTISIRHVVRFVDRGGSVEVASGPPRKLKSRTWSAMMPQRLKYKNTIVC